MCRRCSLRIAAFGVWGVLSLSPVGAAGAQSAVPPAHKQTTTATAKKESPPKAIDVLKALSYRLSAAHTVFFVAVETDERLTRRSEVTLQRPDKLRVSVSGDGPRSESYCNGNTMVTYSPDEKTLNIAKAPPTINECLKAAYKARAVDFPLIDLIVADPYSDLIPGLTQASYVGQSQLAGETNTDIVAYARDNVSVRIWVATQDKLPRRLEAVYLDDPNRLRRSVVFSDWKIDVPVRPEVFTSLVDRADHMNAAEPHPVGTSGIQPAPTLRPLTLHTFSEKYWGSGDGTVQSMPYGAGGYYQSPDGYTYYTPANYGYYPPTAVGCYGAQCYDSGNDYWATEGAAGDASAGFNIALSSSGWDNAVAAPGYNQVIPGSRTNAPLAPGQIVTTLPVGCAAYTRGAAFYLCGSTWFSGVYGPNGQLYFRVISAP